MPGCVVSAGRRRSVSVCCAMLNPSLVVLNRLAFIATLGSCGSTRLRRGGRRGGDGGPWTPASRAIRSMRQQTYVATGRTSVGVLTDGAKIVIPLSSLLATACLDLNRAKLGERQPRVTPPDWRREAVEDAQAPPQQITIDPSTATCDAAPGNRRRFKPHL